MVKPDEFALLAELIKKRSGLMLTEDKDYLIESRLLPVARSRGMQDLRELCAIIRGNAPEDLLVEITEAMTTNESSFFRDIKPYEQLRRIIFPRLMTSLDAQKRMRIWSAACSTGQEPYSISICIQEEAANMPGWNFEIIATDLARKVVGKAQLGIYSQFEVQRGLPIQMLIKYFTSLPDTSWQLRDTIRNMVQFRIQNLLEDYTTLGRFDLIFCRNVLIYFDEPTRAVIIGKIACTLAPHGILVLGSTESLIDPDNKFVPVDGFRGAYTLK